MAQLRKIAKKHKFITEVRGLGLMIGMVLDRPAKPLEVLLREKGLIAIATHDTVIRFLPPLNITAGQVRKAARDRQGRLRGVGGEGVNRELTPINANIELSSRTFALIRG